MLNNDLKNSWSQHDANTDLSRALNYTVRIKKFSHNLFSGCDRGIGHDLAKKLDQIGYQVFAGCLLKGSPGEEKLVNACSDRLCTLQLDVTDTQQVQRAAELVQHHLRDRSRFLFVLRFYGPVNPMGSCRAWSVYLTTCLLGRLSPLSG